MTQELNFYGWQRSGLFDLATKAPGQSQLSIRLDLALQQRPDSPLKTPPAELVESVDLRILGPRSANAIQPQAFTNAVPAPNSHNAETTKRVYVNMASKDLPWRFTPEVASGKVLRPWIVLVAGKTDEITLLPDNQVRLEAALLNEHILSESARWAHVQEDTNTGVSTSRLVSPRGGLEPDQEYIAVVVPAFDETGGDSWPSNSTSVSLPYYFQWRFSTGAAEDFLSLARQLKPGFADAELGRAPLDFGALSLSVRGAIAPLGGIDLPLPPGASDRVNQLRTPQLDARNRAVVGLPLYGAPWAGNPDGTVWGVRINTDPRHRGVAGLGLRAGVQLQEMLARAAADQTGALDAAAQRIRNLTIGLQAARSLWNRRLPQNPMNRLFLLGDSMRRIMTDNGSMIDQIAGGIRPLPQSIFSPAARRMFRRTTALGRFARQGATNPANLLRVANTCPALPPENPAGLPHAKSFSMIVRLNTDEQTFTLLDDKIRAAVDAGTMPHTPLLDELNSLLRLESTGGSSDLGRFTNLGLALQQRIRNGIPHKALVDMFNALRNEERPRARDIATRIIAGGEPSDDDSLLSLGAKLLTDPPSRPCNPVDLKQLEQALSAVIDPTVAEPLVQKRVLATISGLDDQPLAQPEVCIGLDLPVWGFLRDFAPDWLLPGLEGLAEHSVVGMESNPVFVEAFLVGLNMQVLNELRWRNIPIATGCTPLRMFWGLFNVSTGRREPDIRGLETWPSTSDLGHHQSLTSKGRDLVLVFRSDLFRRYQPLVYAVKAVSNVVHPDWENDPDEDAPRSLPSFQGSIGEDITFFRFDLEPDVARGYWIVLEEIPKGYSFRNDINPSPAIVTDGGKFAAETFAKPLRVLIRGDKLIV